MRLLYSFLFSLISLLSFCQQKLTHTVYFDFNATQPSEVAKKELFLFLEQIKQLQVNSLVIEGHSDMKGSDEYNYQLSAARATTVSEIARSFLASGVIMNISSYGKDKLLTPDDERQEINRRVEIIVYYTEKKKEVTRVEPFFEDVETQRFSINLDDTVVVVGKEGTFLKIVPGSITDKKVQVARGHATLVMKEYYRPGDIILSGLSSNSEKGPLETGGMFYMAIIQDGDTMSSKSLNPVTIKMPVVNSSRGNMNIYTPDRPLNTSVWNNTGGLLKQLYSFWEWPQPNGKLSDMVMPDTKFENWKVGQKHTDEYNVYNLGRGYFFDWPMGNSSDAKIISYDILKIDSITLKASVRIIFRNKGIRKYAMPDFDTSFYVKYRRAEYEGLSENINWINCDRFLNYPSVADFYVSTPDFKGANVMVYFKNPNAFLPAFEEGTGLYKVSKVPPGQRVWIVAFGKKDGAYFYSKKEFTIAKDVTTDLALAKISEEDFRKEMKSF